MTDKDIVKALKAHIRRQDKLMRENGKGGYFMRDPLTGNGMLPAEEVLKRLEGDRKFRKALIKVINDLSIDLLGR